MAVVGGRYVIHGLAEAALLRDSHHAVHVDAVAGSVEIRQAPALLQLFTTARESTMIDWTFDRDWKLRHLARICCEIDILLDVAVPLLKADLRSAVGGRMLTRYGWSLRKLGRKVDGVTGLFFAIAKTESNFLRRQAPSLRCGTKGPQWLLPDVAKIEERLLNLKSTVVEIPDVDGDGSDADDDGGGVGVGGGDDDDDDDGK